MKSSGRKGRSRSTSNITTATGEACAGITRSVAAGPGVRRKAENAFSAADVLERETDMHSTPENQSNMEPETAAFSGSLHVTLIMQY